MNIPYIISEENKDLKLHSLEGRLYDISDKISKTISEGVAYLVTLDDIRLNGTRAYQYLVR